MMDEECFVVVEGRLTGGIGGSEVEEREGASGNGNGVTHVGGGVW